MFVVMISQQFDAASAIRVLKAVFATVCESDGTRSFSWKPLATILALTLDPL